MCLQNYANNANVDELRQFSQWILNVGDEKLSEPKNGYESIEIPESFLITNFDDPIHAIVQSTYPNLVHQYKDEEFLHSRTILASTIEIVDEINDCVLSLIPGDESEYLSSNSINKSEEFTTKQMRQLLLNFLTHSGGVWFMECFIPTHTWE